MAQLGGAFGLSLSSDVRPPGAWKAHEQREPRLHIRRVSAETIQSNWSGMSSVGWGRVIDGIPFLVERGIGGDHRFVHGAQPGSAGMPSAETQAIHHLSADASLLQCAPSDPTEPSWWRVVLDSILFTISLLHGYEALHAGAIATPDGVIAISAGAGGGKSTLVAELLGRGYALMADDVLMLESRNTAPPLTHPAPPVMTIPATSLPILSKRAVPQVISSVADELWVAVPVNPEPLPLKALILLDRRDEAYRPGPRASISRIESPLSPLLGSLMSFPSAPERQLARFELASAMALTTELWRLTASLETPPYVLADTLLASTL